MIEQLISAASNGLEETLNFLVHWPLLISFVFITGIANKIAKSRKFKKTVNLKTRTIWRSGIIAVIMGVTFFLISDAEGFKEVLKEVVKILFTIGFVMTILIVGLKNALEELKRNWQTIKNSLKTLKKP